MKADVESWIASVQLAGPDMLIDGYDQYNEQENEVVNISPDDASEEPAETLLRADDCMDIVPRLSSSPLTQSQSKP